LKISLEVRAQRLGQGKAYAYEIRRWEDIARDFERDTVLVGNGAASRSIEASAMRRVYNRRIDEA
jgi:hypothetical protein